MRSSPFVANNRDQLELLHHVGSAYGQRPSSLIGIQDPLAALNFDVYVRVVGNRAEERAYQERPSASTAVNKAKPKQPSGGKRQATRSDWLALMR